MYTYIPHILPLSLEEAQAEIQRRLYEEYAYGRLFNCPDVWDLQATIRVREAEKKDKGN